MCCPETTDYLKGFDFVEGRNTPYEFNGKHYVVLVTNKLPVMAKELSEIKGAVISDYQAHLEKKWLSELSIKYPVNINYDVFYSLGSND